jgi:hypothetical protein
MVNFSLKFFFRRSVAANQVFVVVAKYTGTAPTAAASGKLAARTVTQIKLLVCLNHCISSGVFLYEI